MLLWIVGGVVGVALLAGFVWLYVWTRRSEREIEIPTRERTFEERQDDLPGLGAAGNTFFGGF